MLDTEFARGVQTAAQVTAGVLEASLIGAIVLSPVTMAPLYAIFSTADQLQLVTHLPFLPIAVAANTKMAQGYLVQVVMFDIPSDEFKMEIKEKILGPEDVQNKFENPEDVDDIPG